MIFQFHVEVFKVLAQDTVYSALRLRSLTFQFLVVFGILVEVFKVSSQDRIHQLLPQRIALLLRMRRLSGFSHFSPKK